MRSGHGGLGLLRRRPGQVLQKGPAIGRRDSLVRFLQLSRGIFPEWPPAPLEGLLRLLAALFKARRPGGDPIRKPSQNWAPQKPA